MKFARRFTSRRRYPGEGERLIKYVYLKDDEFWYRSLRAHKSQADISSDLNEYHKGFERVDKEYWITLRNLLILWGVALLVATGVLKKATILGLDIDSTNFGLFFLPASAFLSLRNGVVSLKRLMISSIFSNHYKAIPPSSRVDLIARFPMCSNF